MMGVTHLVGGAAAWVTVAAAGSLGPVAAVAGAAVAGYFALVPDIGQRGTMAANSLPPVTWVVSWVIRHGPGGHDHRKGWLHAYAGMIICAVASVLAWAAARAWLSAHPTYTWLPPHLSDYLAAHHLLFTTVPWWLPVAAVLGYVSHVVLDLMTLSGCCLLWPDTSRVFHLLPYGARVETGLQKKRLKLPGGGTTRGKHHTAEWWVVRPVLVVVLTGMSVLVALGR
jgi:membrane-bound metal-dependent hydrolase YbcI (DUF457 family)